MKGGTKIQPLPLHWSQGIKSVPMMVKSFSFSLCHLIAFGISILPVQLQSRHLYLTEGTEQWTQGFATFLRLFFIFFDLDMA